MRSFLVAIGLFFFLAQNSFAAISYVVHVSSDGLGAVYLQRFVKAAPEQFPNFVRLQTEGAFTYNARCDYGASETIPNHASMFTGRPALQPAGFPNTVHHGLINNFPASTDTFHNTGNLNVPYKASIFDVAHDYGISTAFYSGKSKLGICDRSYNALNGGFDVTGEDNGRDKIDFALFADYADYYGNPFTNEVNVLIDNLNSSAPNRYSFIHIAEPDITGHFYPEGWGGTAWSNVVRLVDQQIGRIFAAIESNPALSNRTALLVTTDHGGGGLVSYSHSEPQFLPNYTIPFFLWAPGIPAGADLYSLFSARVDPGTNRIEYTTGAQPIRNGDSGNLALMLLGLPTIPGSLMQPTFAPTIVRSGSNIALTWPAAAVDHVLEFADDLTPPVQWRSITGGITESNGLKLFSPNTASSQGRYYSLRRN
jgi:hypothetical protein